MNMIKFCDEIGCETMTTSRFCKTHTEEVPAETQTQAPADMRLKEVMEGEEKLRQWAERAKKIDAMRAELAELRGPGGRSNTHPQPTFSNHAQGNNYE
jgi:hypothetical protein